MGKVGNEKIHFDQSKTKMNGKVNMQNTNNEDN